MLNVILVMTPQGGIGLDNKLPWNCPEELSLFRRLTMGSVCVVSRKTGETLPKLDGRHVVYVSHNKEDDYTVEKVIENDRGCGDMFIIGGAQIYDTVLRNHKEKINTLFLSVMDCEYHYDTKIDLALFKGWCIKTEQIYDKFTHYTLSYSQNVETKYLALLNETLMNGVEKQGRNGLTKSLFAKSIDFNLLDGFPLLTTKRMFLKGIVEELLFFIRGETDTKLLEDKGVNIWKGNTTRQFLDSIGLTYLKEGLMGPLYGSQFRNYGGIYNKETGRTEGGVDQLQYVIDTIKNDPSSRRIMLTSFNPSQVAVCALYPCHSNILQFSVCGEYIDTYCFNRSSDLFLGLPFNIASTSILVMLIAILTNKKARNITIALGDCHIYDTHYTAVKEQISRLQYSLPVLNINNNPTSLKNIQDMDSSFFVLERYKYHPAIRVAMVA